MLRVGGWLKGHTPTHTKSPVAQDEVAQIQDAMSAVAYIMDDDIETAEAQLGKGESPFHQLGIGICTFLRATLGFEEEVMRDATDKLSQAENSAYEQQRQAQRDSNTYQSPIFPPGTEYAVCQAESQLMSAVVGVLNESLTEAIKSFYKLRKAYLALEKVMDHEKQFLAQRSVSPELSVAGSDTSSKAKHIHENDESGPSKRSRPGTPIAAASVSKSSPDASLRPDVAKTEKDPVAEQEERSNVVESNDDDEFVDAEEDHTIDSIPVHYTGHISVPMDRGASADIDNASRMVPVRPKSASEIVSAIDNSSSQVPSINEDSERWSSADPEDVEDDLSSSYNHPIDVFILSGSKFIFGMLLLLLSFIPPSFAMLLKVVGFKGDRERGMHLLWKATKFDNIHGAMASAVLMGYLNGFTNFCDIIPAAGEGSYPKERLTVLMNCMRKRYPKSHLFLLEEARMLAVEKEIEKAIEFTEKAGASSLKQLEALGWFERSLNNMYMHDYVATAAAFEKCVTLNDWSHGLYYYICGSAYVELYRRQKEVDPSTAADYAAKATSYIQKVIPNTGKKKFMAKQLPFDVFITRKVHKWEQRAAKRKCDLIDAVGVSPLEEMIYFWNGYKRMRPIHLEVSLQNLAWSENSANSAQWLQEDDDEKSILVLLRAATLRNLGSTMEAKALLKKEILGADRTPSKDHLKDNWMAPCARYEMAANTWREAESVVDEKERMKKLHECRDYLDEVTKWGAFDLDARIGMRVMSGKGTLRKLGVLC